MSFLVRPERTADRAAIFEVHARAFPTDAEAKLVDRLRAAGAATISLVAEQDGRVVGHICFSPVWIVAANGERHGAIGLAPVAVAPELQKADIGGALIRGGFEACLAIGQPLVFVLGHPSYYPRFGFEPAAPHGLHYGGGADFAPAFFVRELVPGALAGRSGTVHYHPELAAP